MADRMRIAQADFHGGEISDLLFDRVDLEMWQASAASLVNMIPRIQGTAHRRSGTRFVAQPKTGADGRLINFVKAFGDAVIIEVGNQYLRYFDGQTFTPILSSGNPVETSTPYSLAQARALTGFQSLDVMWLCEREGALAPRRLARFSDTSWNLAAFSFEEGPWLPANEVENRTLAFSALTGGITITAANYQFQESQLNSWIRVWNNFFGTGVKRWEPNVSVTAAESREYDGRVYNANNAGTTGNQPPVHERGEVSDGEILWGFVHDGAARVRITGSVPPDTWPASEVTGTVFGTLPTTGPTQFWALQAFSGQAGWPRMGTIFEERLIFASTPFQPDTIFCSNTGDYGPDGAVFKPGTGSGEVVDSDAITRTLAGTKVNTPGWIVATELILLGTPAGIVRVTGPSIDEPVTPAGMVARRMPGSIGCDIDVDAAEAGEALLYAARGGRRVIEYPLDSGASRDLTVRAEHVGNAPIIRLEWAQEPHGRLFTLRNDGRLYCLVYHREQDHAAWCEIRLGGRWGNREPFVSSIAVAPDTRGIDRLWLWVKRTLNGQTRWSIEVLEDDFDARRDLPERAAMMDAHVRVNGWNANAASTITLTGADLSRDAVVDLSAAGHSPFTAGRVGDVLRLRRISLPGHAGDVEGDVRLELLTRASNSASGTARLLTDCPAGLAGVALTGWGWEVASVTAAHLANEGVQLWVDGADMGHVTANGSGVITLPEPGVHVIAGLPVPWRVLTLPLAGSTDAGDGRGLTWQGEDVTVKYLRSGPARVRYVADDVPMERADIAVRDEADLIGAVPRLKSGHERITLDCPAARSVQVEVYGDGPAPFTLSMIAGRVLADD